MQELDVGNHSYNTCDNDDNKKSLNHEIFEPNQKIGDDFEQELDVKKGVLMNDDIPDGHIFVFHIGRLKLK